MQHAKRGAAKSRTTLADLGAAGLLAGGDSLYFAPGAGRPAEGPTRVTVTSEGHLQDADGRQFASLTDAATLVGGSIRNGWDCWRVGGPRGPKIKELRTAYEQAHATHGTEPGP